MKLSKKLVNAAAAAAVMLVSAPSAVWAESAVPEPAFFFGTTPEFDPNAAGTKYAGTMTIAYEFTPDEALPPVGCGGIGDRRITNMFVVITLHNRSDITPFNTDFRANPDPDPTIGKSQTPSFCFLGEDKQIAFVLEMIRTRIVPTLYEPCTARPLDPSQINNSSCPEFKIKSITNMFSSGHGSLRADITLAVRD